MAKQININDNSNKVNLEDVNPKIVVRDDNKNTIVNVESKNTKIVQVNTPGPRGPKGDVGPSGSVDGVVITDNNDNEKKKVLFVIEQPGGSGTTGSLGTDSNLQALSFNPSEEILFSSNISSSGFLKGYNITASGKISASQQIIGPSATLGKFFLSSNIISNTDDDTTKITFEGSDKIMITVNDEDGIDIESSQENDKIIFYKKADFKSSISASGAFFFSSSLNDDTNFKTLVYDTSTGKVFHTGSYGGGGGGVGFPYSGSDAQFGTPPQAIITGSLLLSGSGHITASGNISASGNFEGNSYEIQGKSAITYNSGNNNIIYGQNNQNFKARGVKILLGDDATQHVTASGNISASGIIIGGEFTSSKGILITSSLTNLGSKNAFLVRFNNSNGQPEKFSVSSSGVVRFGSLDTLPTPITGGIVYSASNFYFGI